MIGNFIADFVKGNKKNNYPEGVKAGIELHRSIDDYTDHHEITSVSKSRLYPKQHKYAGPVVDVFYDHFLLILLCCKRGYFYPRVTLYPVG